MLLKNPKVSCWLRDGEQLDDRPQLGAVAEVAAEAVVVQRCSLAFARVSYNGKQYVLLLCPELRRMFYPIVVPLLLRKLHRSLRLTKVQALFDWLEG